MGGWCRHLGVERGQRSTLGNRAAASARATLLCFSSHAPFSCSSRPRFCSLNGGDLIGTPVLPSPPTLLPSSTLPRSHLPQVHVPPGLLHGNPDQVCRRASHPLLLARPVRCPVARRLGTPLQRRHTELSTLNSAQTCKPLAPRAPPSAPAPWAGRAGGPALHAPPRAARPLVESLSPAGRSSAVGSLAGADTRSACWPRLERRGTGQQGALQQGDSAAESRSVAGTSPSEPGVKHCPRQVLQDQALIEPRRLFLASGRALASRPSPRRQGRRTCWAPATRRESPRLPSRSARRRRDGVGAGRVQAAVHAA